MFYAFGDLFPFLKMGKFFVMVCEHVILESLSLEIVMIWDFALPELFILKLYNHKF